MCRRPSEEHRIPVHVMSSRGISGIDTMNLEFSERPEKSRWL